MKAAIEQDDVTTTETTPTPASQTGAAAEYLHIPIGGRGSMVAAIFLRSSTDESLDSNDGPATRWESKGYWNGNQVFYGGDFINRLYAIEDAARAIGVAAAESTKKNEKKASQQIMAWLEQMDATNDDGPEGKPCVWPESEGEMLAHEVPGNELDENIPEGYHRCPGGIAKDGECPHCDSVAAEDPAVVPPAGLAGEGSVSGDGEPADESANETTAASTTDNPNDHFTAQFQNAMAELATATLDYVDRKAEFKRAEKRFKSAMDELKSVADRGVEKLPLFDRVDESDSSSPTPPQAEASGSEPGEDGGTAEQTDGRTDGQPTDQPEAWRTEPLSSLGLPPKLAERLEENGISTIGQLEDKRAEFNGLRSIKGIGQAKVDLIETAVIDWLTKNRDRREFEAAAAAESAAAVEATETTE